MQTAKKEWMLNVSIRLLGLAFATSLLLFGLCQTAYAMDETNADDPAYDYLEVDLYAESGVPTDLIEQAYSSTPLVEPMAEPAVVSKMPKPLEANVTLATSNLAPLAQTPFERLKADILAAQPNADTLITLSENVEFSETLLIDGNRRITLANTEGTNISLTRTKLLYPMIKVAEEAALTLAGTSNDALVFDGERKDIIGIYDTPSFLLINGETTIEHATFTGAFTVQHLNSTAPIYVKGEKAKLTIEDVLIEKNSYNGSSSVWYVAGGISADQKAQLIINGGTIRDNDVAIFDYPSFLGFWANVGSAGAITVDGGAVLTLNNCEIYNNRSSTGAISIGNVDGINIIHRISHGDVSNLPVVPQSKAIFNGGNIYNNKGGGESGAIMVCGNAELLMPSDTTVQIHDNKGYQGGGILVYDLYVQGSGAAQVRRLIPYDEWNARYKASLVMEGGKIYKNLAYACGGGVNASSNDVHLSGGEITDNIAGDQGGGVYVTATPYILHVKDAWIGNNNAITRSTGASAVSEDDGNGGRRIYALTNGGGGGIWFCPTGNAELYIQDGVAFWDNLAEVTGADFHNEEKVPGHFTVTLPSRSQTGIRTNWYDDLASNRYSATNANLHENIVDVNTSMSLKNVTAYRDALLSTKDQYKLQITGNRASKGGGLGTNGSIIFGTSPDESDGYYRLTVRKNWQNVAEDARQPVEISLKLKDGTLLEKVILNKENNWTFDFDELPKTVEGKDLKDLLTIVEDEASASKFVFTVGELLENGTETVEKTQAGQVKHYNVGLLSLTGTNKPHSQRMMLEKRWEKDKATDRPNHLNISLKLGNTTKLVPLNPANNWRAEIADVEPNLSLDDILVEEPTVLGYKLLRIDKSQENRLISIVLHNEKRPPTSEEEPDNPPLPQTTINVSGNKHWLKDDENKRPKSIELELWQNGKSFKRQNLTGIGNTWQYSFSNLPKADDAGKLYQYEVREVVPTGYQVSYLNGDITNTWKPILPIVPEEPDEPEIPPVPPHHADEPKATSGEQPTKIEANQSGYVGKLYNKDKESRINGSKGIPQTGLPALPLAFLLFGTCLLTGNKRRF